MAGEEPSDGDEHDEAPREVGGSPPADAPSSADDTGGSAAEEPGGDGKDDPGGDGGVETSGTPDDAVDDGGDAPGDDENADTEDVGEAPDEPGDDDDGVPTDSVGEEAGGDGDGGDGDAGDGDEGEAGAIAGHEAEESDGVIDDRGTDPGSIFDRREGPQEDREMPLTDHVEEMIRRLAVVVALAGLVSLFVFPFADRVVNFLWYSIMPGVPSEIARPRLYGVLEKLFTEVKVASLAGLIVALPVLVYETYAFMRPGLYPHERRYYLAAVPTSLVLAIVGVSFAYFVILPAIFVYFLYYSQDVATIGFALGRTFDLILLLMGYMALVFQIPLFIMLAMMMGLVTRRWLAARRLLFWGGFLGLSFLFSPDPTGMAPIVVAATMIVLFEGTLLLTKWTGRE